MLKKFMMILIAVSASSAFAAESPIHSEIHDKTGRKIGEVTVLQEKNGVTFIVSASHLTPGLHGIHIHSAGKCDAPDFKSSQGHFAFAGQSHGMDNPKGPHLGDMPNLNAKADGKAHLRFHTDLVTLGEGKNSLKKPGGTSLIIHETQDDQKSDPAGNSGSRIACAVLSK